MPRSWSQKDERQYQHIQQSELDQGKSVGKAKEIAARTVNKQRREAGRTPQKSTQGTGNPHSRLESRTSDELQNLAAKYHVEGRSKMKKAELIEAIREKR
tara:strand:+ start:1892 stop:2191 length:300 start_codon:yes stop_codon:yes gene_type:complete